MKSLNRPLWAAAISWLLGSTFVVLFIFATGPHEFLKGWHFYILLTFGISLAGVLVAGLPVLAAISYLCSPKNKIYHPFASICAGLFLGWLAMTLLTVGATHLGGTVQGTDHWYRVLGSGFFGSLYGVIGFFVLSILTRRAEQGAAANP